MNPVQRASLWPTLPRGRDFALLWVGLLISGVGDWVNYVAMVAVVFQQTHSTAMLALLRLFHIVPIVVLAPIVGVFVDRWNRKRLLILTPLIAALALLPLARFHPIGAVFSIYLVITVCMLFFNPARTAVLPAIVAEDELVAANSLTQITATASIVLGGLVGGGVVAALGPGPAFVLDGLSFAVVAALVLPVRIAGPVRQPSATRHDLVEGLRLVRDQPVVGAVVMVGGLLIVPVATALTLGIAFTHDQLHGGAAAYGVLLAGLGAGSALAAAWTIAAPSLSAGMQPFALFGLVLGAGSLWLGLTHSVPLAAVAYGLTGFGSVASTVAGVTLLQHLVPDALRGRVFSIASTFDHLGAFASTLVVGLGAGMLPAGEMIAGSGAIAAIAAGGSLLMTRRRP